jgi:broad-specificity NMP kinase
MIIFINGAFGVGKTTVAELLVSRLPNSPGQSHLNFQAACRAHLYSRALRIGLL